MKRNDLKCLGAKGDQFLSPVQSQVALRKSSEQNNLPELASALFNTQKDFHKLKSQEAFPDLECESIQNGSTPYVISAFASLSTLGTLVYFLLFKLIPFGHWIQKRIGIKKIITDNQDIEEPELLIYSYDNINAN
ncbi:hypothetical protein POVWA1_088820 [Plasmodium ovale wallikeri]|uniref:PIR Superfamily Protein n=1 Tax=Plasmodium ovale wallikeri TaxID=864142 RepID=A0A1A9AQU3_PLAOA|nr:hypothetical protein POVWA1_088820 [Plasmodium ovale wallikeri]